MTLVYYAKESYREWCHQGDLALMEFRQQRRARVKQRRHHHIATGTVRKHHSPYKKETQSQAKHRSVRRRQTMKNSKKIMISISSKQKHSVPNDQETTPAVVCCTPLNKHFPSSCTGHPEVPEQTVKQGCRTTSQAFNDDVADENSIGLHADVDDDSGPQVMMMNGDKNLPPVDKALIPNQIIKVDIPTNAELPVVEPVTQSSSSMASSCSKRNYRASVVVAMDMATKRLKKTPKVFTAARSKFTATASKHSTFEDPMSFTVKGVPPQYIALVEGIHTTASSINVKASYYTSQRYQYLSDIVDHGQYHQLPTDGYATELPCVSPAAPGHWMVEIVDQSTNGKLFFRTHQSDWNGSSIRLAHMDYKLRLPSNWANYETLGSDISVVRIDPTRHRISNIDDDDDDDYDDDTIQQKGKNSFIGAMGITIFDGFDSLSESEAFQHSLAKEVLKELRRLMQVQRTPPIVPAFAANKFDSIPTKYVSGSGGMVIPVNIGCQNTAGRCEIYNSSDYFILLYTCEELNQVIAIDVVFGKISEIHSKDKMNLGSDTDSPTFDRKKKCTLTHQNLQQHISKWSPVDVFRRFWENKKHSQSPVEDVFELKSSLEVNDGWTPHDELLVRDNASEHDMVISYDHNDKENSRPMPPNTFEDAFVNVPMNENTMLVIQDDRIIETKHRQTTTPYMPSQIRNANDITAQTIVRQPLQISMMMNQITPTPLPNQIDASYQMPGYPGRVPVAQNLERKTLFRAIKTDHGTHDTVTSHTAKNSATSISPKTGDPPKTQLLHHPVLSPTAADKENNDVTSSPSESNHSIVFPCNESIGSVSVVDDEEVFDMFFDANDDSGNVFVVAEHIHHPVSIPDILFYELQNADYNPEMEITEVAKWYEQHNVHAVLWTSTDSTMYFHDVLFGGLLAFDPDGEDENFAWFCWYNWLIPGYTLVTALYFFSRIVAENQYLYDFLNDVATNDVRGDSSHGLLAALMFVETDSGYIGAICIE